MEDDTPDPNRLRDLEKALDAAAEYLREYPGSLSTNEMANMLRIIIRHPGPMWKGLSKRKRGEEIKDLRAQFSGLDLDRFAAMDLEDTDD